VQPGDRALPHQDARVAQVVPEEPLEPVLLHRERLLDALRTKLVALSGNTASVDGRLRQTRVQRDGDAGRAVLVVYVSLAHARLAEQDARLGEYWNEIRARAKRWPSER
jgi:hypothetical protein